jgi:hypothetical protein
MERIVGRVFDGCRRGVGLRGAGVMLALLCAALCIGPSPAAAQSFLDRLFQPFFPSPPPQVYRSDPYRWTRPPPPKPRPRPRPVVEKPVEKPATRFVAVFGDGLGQTLGQELIDVLADVPEVGVLRRARDGAGLARDDFGDWTKEVRDLLDGRLKIDVAVVMVGSNDRQAIHEGGATGELLTPAWKTLYAARVRALATLFQQHGVPLIWVGLPIMKNDRFAADMSGFNDIYREQATAAGAVFVDTWEAFGDAKGQYSPFGPNTDGQTVRLRAADGVHFTKAGARKLAHFVEADVRRFLDSRGVKGPEAGIRAPGAANPARDAVAPPDTSVAPVAGPVMSLTAPASTPGGVLVTKATGAAGSDAAAALIDRTLVEGRPVGAKPGRADDHRWPQP